METTKYHIYFDFKYYKVRINKAPILQMGYPKLVRLLVHQDRKELIVQPCNQHEPLAYKVPKDFAHSKNGLEFNSLSLITTIYRTFGWDMTARYIAYGRYIEKENIVVFDLGSGERIVGGDV